LRWSSWFVRSSGCLGQQCLERVGDGGEAAFEGLAVFGSDGAEEGGGKFFVLDRCALHEGGALLGEGDEVGTPIGGVRGARDVARCLECVDESADVARGYREGGGERLLRRGALVMHCPEHRHAGRREIGSLERARHIALEEICDEEQTVKQRNHIVTLLHHYVGSLIRLAAYDARHTRGVIGNRGLIRRAISTFVLASVGLLVAVGCTGCGVLSAADGDALASAEAEGVAEQIAAHTDNTTEVTLLEMVAYWVPERPVYTAHGTATAEPLAWSGQIGSETPATIDVRIHVDVESSSSTQIFGPSNSAGEATRCYRLVWPRYDPASITDLPCDALPAPERPAPPPRPELDDVDRATVEEILRESETAAEIETRLTEEFSAEYIVIETDDVAGELVAAVGIPAERDCIVAVRGADGDVTFPGFDRISLEPGEMGCSTALYTDPPL
jgi:hypothetical protein